MHINGPDGIGAQGLPGGKPQTVRKTAAETPSPANENVSLDVGLKSINADYIRQANDSDEVNAAAVAEARKLLESGLLDTPEAAQRAAEAIFKLGQ